MIMPSRHLALAAHGAASLVLILTACGSDKSPASQIGTDAQGGDTSLTPLTSSVATAQSGGSSSTALASNQDTTGGALVGQGGATVSQAGSSAGVAGATASAAVLQTATVTLVPNLSYRTLEGFGAALAQSGAR